MERVECTGLNGFRDAYMKARNTIKTFIGTYSVIYRNCLCLGPNWLSFVVCFVCVSYHWLSQK